MSHSSTKPLPVDISDIVSRFLARRKSGEAVTIEQFANEHPELRDDLLSVLPTVDLLENADLQTPINPMALDSLPLELMGEYQLKKLVGFGGMGTVYEAESSLRSRIALKIMVADAKERSSQRFEREAKIVADLHHPNIVPVFDFGYFENLKYMSMRFIDGPNFSDVLKARKNQEGIGEQAVKISQELDTNWPKIAEIGVQAASALAYAHEKGVLHRDIKPGNLIIDSNLNTWVTDFGLAKFCHIDSSLTKTGNAVGTIQYMAPEQLENIADERTDIYSLGLTLYELTQKSNRSSSSVYTRHPLQPPSKSQPSIPKGLEKAILKACNPEPEKRFQTAAEFAEALEPFCQCQQLVRSSQMTKRFQWIFLAVFAMLIGCWVGNSTLSLLLADSDVQMQTQSDFKPTMFDLQIGDIVQYKNTDWEIDGQCIYNKQGFTWQEYLMRNGERRLWLSVEEDDWVEIIVWSKAKNLEFSGREPSVKLNFDGVDYHRVESAEAEMTFLRANKRPTVDRFKYYQYESDGQKMLNIEDWTGAIEVYEGHKVNAKDLTITYANGQVVSVSPQSSTAQ